MAPKDIVLILRNSEFEVVRYFRSFARRIINLKKIQSVFQIIRREKVAKKFRGTLDSLVVKSAILFTSALAFIPRKDHVSICADRS